MTLTQIYGRIPEVHCKGLCHEACGPIPAFQNEPIFPLTEPRFIDPHIPGARLTKASEEVYILDPETISCPHLDAENRCSQYEARPAICRMYGASIGMECPFGCVPDRWLSRKDGLKILEQVRHAEGAIK